MSHECLLGKPEQSLGFVLNDTARLLRRTFNRHAQEKGLTQTQWQVLLYLARNEGSSQAQLADFLEVQPISAGRLIDRMVAADLVTREADPNDRRAVKLYISEKAEPILKEIKGCASNVRAKAFAGLNEQQQQQLLDMLLLIRQNLID